VGPILPNRGEALEFLSHNNACTVERSDLSVMFRPWLFFEQIKLLFAAERKLCDRIFEGKLFR
jgi:hypothetical protein